MKYRIAIQQVSLGTFKHVHNIMLDSDNEQNLIKTIRASIKKEINAHENKKNG